MLSDLTAVGCGAGAQGTSAQVTTPALAAEYGDWFDTLWYWALPATAL